MGKLYFSLGMGSGGSCASNQLTPITWGENPFSLLVDLSIFDIIAQCLEDQRSAVRNNLRADMGEACMNIFINVVLSSHESCRDYSHGSNIKGIGVQESSDLVSNQVIVVQFEGGSCKDGEHLKYE